MLRVLRETTRGVPKSKGSLSGYAQGKCDNCGQAVKMHARLVEKKTAGARQDLQSWRIALQTTLQRYTEPIIAEQRGSYLQPVAVALTFYLPRPASAPSYVIRPTTTPDIDKLVRVVLDELKGIVLKDDRQIVNLGVLEYFASGEHDPGVEIEVWAV